jgi:SAM-dependent methyltransferase
MQVNQHDYWRCETCQATHLDASQRLDVEQELAYYALHENKPDDQDYRRFLSRLLTPLLAVLPAASEGLDYGCGPGPTLAMMLEEAGHPVRLYDPFFHPDEAVLQGQYDFITCTEVVEHLHRPFEVFERLNRLLKPGGVLAIMTCFQTDDARFANWHYRRDPTHVVFYREETFHFIASRFGWLCEIPCSNVVLMHQPPATLPMDTH